LRNNAKPSTTIGLAPSLYRFPAIFATFALRDYHCGSQKGKILGTVLFTVNAALLSFKTLMCSSRLYREH
jgi:hypothetical protein